MNVFGGWGGGGDPDYTKTSYLLTQEGIDSFCTVFCSLRKNFPYSDGVKCLTNVLLKETKD